MWTPEVDPAAGPRYREIARALEEDIRRGALASGARLPTQRRLARELGVTVGTVGRAYAEVERLGLISGEVGRGTFVRRQGADDLEPADRSLPSRQAAFTDLALNVPPEPLPAGAAGRALQETLVRIGRRPPLDDLLRYGPHAGSERHRQAGRRWLARLGLDVGLERVLVTCGSQHALTVALMAVTRPGDALLVEELTYPGLRAVAGHLGLELVPVAMDAEGLSPTALGEAAERFEARCLYTIPTIQNPTGRVQSPERRRAIAKVARQLDLWVIEDDVHGAFPRRPLPPIASELPERTLYAANLSKCVAPGLRVGYLAVPEPLLDATTRALWTSIWAVPPLMAEIAAEWIDDGTAERLLAGRRTVAEARQRLAKTALDGWRTEGHPAGIHLWLHLREGTCAKELALGLRRRGVGVTPSSAFVVGRAAAPSAVRVCLGAAADDADLLRALKVLRSALDSPVEPGVGLL